MQGQTERTYCRTTQKSGISRLMSRAMPFLFVLLVIFLPPSVAHSADIVSSKRVLFINSYSRDYVTVPVVVNEVERELKGVATIQYVFMNTKNLDTAFAIEQTKRELAYLRGKYGFDFDLIITGDDDALDFVRNNRDAYFKNIPVIFENVNSEKKVKEAVLDPLMAGVVETFPLQETVALAFKLNSKAKQVVVITDETLSSKGTEEQIANFKAVFPQLTFVNLVTTKYKTEELRQQLGTYGDETILLFNMLSIDGSGQHYTIANGVNFVCQAAKIPVFKGDEAGIGDGLLGGCALSYESVGIKTGQMAKQVLNGERTPQQLGYLKGDYTHKFDFEVMKRFKISKNQLPKDTVYINDPPSFFELHADVIRPAGIVLLVLVIGILLYDRKRSKRFSMQLARSEAEVKIAELSNKAKTDFLSRMSHDIRTPLNAIIGLTDLAEDDIKDPLKTKDNLHKIHDSGIVLLALLNDVLDVSRIESGRLSLNEAPCNLQDFVQEMHTVFDGQCQKLGLTFQIEAETAIQTVLLDRVRFSQLIGNLLSNAIKFTARGGRVCLAIQPGQIKEGIMSCTFMVSDTGKGIAPEFQKRMFEPFTQEAEVAELKVGGSGLGLAIVKKLTDIMHGTIAVKSALGRGSTFTLVFPLTLAAVKLPFGVVAATGVTADNTCLKGKRILLVEDHPLNIEIATRMLEKVGLLVVLAENGYIAVQKFQAAPPKYYDLILMDIRMPVMDGREATRIIRTLGGEGKSIPIVAMTADAFDGDMHRSLESGMNAQLNKPIEPKALYAMLRNFLC